MLACWWQPRGDSTLRRGLVKENGGRGASDRGIARIPRETFEGERQREIMNMSLEDMEKELAAFGWKPKPKDDLPVSEEELLVGIEETACTLDANLSRESKEQVLHCRRWEGCQKEENYDAQ
jgi:hypothetical protein